MLARAALRSLSIRSPPAGARSCLAIQTRCLAKNSRPKKPYAYNSPTRTQAGRHGPNAQTPLRATEGSIAREAFQNARDSASGRETSAAPGREALQNETARQDGAEDKPVYQSDLGPLPDLIRGIPPTLEAELGDSTKKSSPQSLNITEAPAEAGGSGGGDLPRSAYISSFERRRNRWANYFYAFTVLTTTTTTILLGRNWETEEEERLHPHAPSGWGLKLFYNRAKARLSGTLDYYNEPAFQKLLPNPDPMWERPYTLVISLEDMLVHSEWDREHGWRMAKRPGTDYFLRYLSQYYELVIFTSVPSMIGHPIINKLDPYHIVMWPLFREATKYKNGEYIKDLSFLNRPLSKVILLDTDPAHARNQPENAVILPKWKGNPNDKELISFIPFLEYVASMEFSDTREVLKSFEDKYIPAEFAKREAKARERFEEQLAAERGRGSRKSLGGLGGLFGMKTPAGGPDGMDQTLSEGFAKGKMYQDQVRERGQRGYEMLEKEIRENGEKWLKDMAEEEKKMNEEAMKGMKNSITSVFPFGGSKPSPSSSTSSSS